MTITLKRTVNLSEPILPEVLPAPLYEGEKNAHTFMITAEKDKLPHALSGSVVAYFERNDGNTVRVEGETKDGAAILTLSPECYQTGVFYLAVMLISDGAQTVIYAASGRVRNTQDGEIIDGGNTIPTYDEIMAHLEKYLSTDITAKVEETEDGALITMKDVVNGETTALVKNGKSAYEIAKENGFEGTEEEWLESLKGEGGGTAEAQIFYVSGTHITSERFSLDKTDAEIIAAYKSGKTVVCRYAYDSSGNNTTMLTLEDVIETSDAYSLCFNGIEIYGYLVQLRILAELNSDGVTWTRTAYYEKNQIYNDTAYPNPYELIITTPKGERISYNGSKYVEANLNSISWNDLKDRPFGNDVPLDMNVTFNENAEAPIFTPFYLTPGRSYKITTAEGMTFTNTAVERTNDGVTAVCLGNFGPIYGEADTGEPYVLFNYPESVGGLYGGIIVTDASLANYVAGNTVPLKVEAADGAIPIPSEFIPTMSETQKGGAKVGEGLTVDADEKLRVKQEVLDQIDQNKTDIDSLAENKADKTEIPDPYTLPTASAEVKGGAKVGNGLRMNGEALEVVPEGEYELIEKIIIGYELLTEQPEDWATNWTAYYRNTGTLREPVYTLIDDATAPVWAANTFYAYSTDVTSCVRNKTPEGTWYDFTSVLINFLLPTGASTPGANTEIYSSNERKLITTIWVAASDASSGPKRQRQEIKLEHGMWAAYYTTYDANAAQVYLRTHNTNMIGKMQAEYPNISQIALPRHANGAIMEIYGVWENG